ncbi:MAG: 4Fe-4S dicluster domain-containing protein [Candidatus Omnitrophica bacterium]|nr:4Fe-4S dicluster domain-containing protein [Candidatus Omnitrophota bacterium]
MSQVTNWQINRKMEYPHAESHPRRQFAFVFNLNRCIACQTCSFACKTTWTFSKGQEAMWWNNVETKPYGGYPQFWDVKLLSLLEEANPGGQVWKNGVFEGKTIFEAAQKSIGPEPQRALGYLPTDEEWRFPNIYEDTAVGGKGKPGAYDTEGAELPVHKTWFFYLARICNHCTYPGCLAACPRNAIYKRPEDGVVLVDQTRCRGYRKCVEACPYKKAMYRPSTRITEKCIACYPRLEGRDPETNGLPMETRCMAACIGRIRLQGFVTIGEGGQWAEDRYNPLYYLVKVAKVALPLYPQFGTEPNGYYIPPRWVPRDYLKQMFGPGVDQAIEAYQVPDRELLAVQQLFRITNRIIFRYGIVEGPKVFETEVHGKPFTLYNDTVIGFDESGKEIIRTQVEEPFYVRPDKHQNSI